MLYNISTYIRKQIDNNPGFVASCGVMGLALTLSNPRCTKPLVQAVKRLCKYKVGKSDIFIYEQIKVLYHAVALIMRGLLDTGLIFGFFSLILDQSAIRAWSDCLFKIANQFSMGYLAGSSYLLFYINKLYNQLSGLLFLTKNNLLAN